MEDFTTKKIFTHRVKRKNAFGSIKTAISLSCLTSLLGSSASLREIKFLVIFDLFVVKIIRNIGRLLGYEFLGFSAVVAGLRVFVHLVVEVGTDEEVLRVLRLEGNGLVEVEEGEFEFVEVGVHG